MTIDATKRFTGGTGLGPRMAKLVEEAMRDFRREAMSQTRLSGVHGKPETESRSSYIIMGGSTVRPDAQTFLDPVGEKYGWVVTASNYKDVIADIQAATSEMRKSRPAVDERITAEEDAENKARIAGYHRDEEERRTAASDAWASINAKRPAWAQAIIVASFRSDDSDIMTDYSGHHTTRTVAIGWRSGSREDFRQLREAAGRFEPTKHLGPGCDDYKIVCLEAGSTRGEYLRDDSYDVIRCTTEAEARATATARIDALRAERDAAHAKGEAWSCNSAERNLLENGYTLDRESVEHRDNYSMGEGNWLGIHRHGGWVVKSRHLVDTHDVIEDAIPDAPAAPAADAETLPRVEGVRVSINEAKGGVEIRFPDKPDAGVLARLKANGWRWARFSSCWYNKRTPEAEAFAHALAAQ